MCGIAGFLSNVAWTEETSLDWLDEIIADLNHIDIAEPQTERLEAITARLGTHFDALMRFPTHLAVVQYPEIRQQFEKLVTRLSQLESALSRSVVQRGRVTLHRESLRDYCWQVRAEVLENVNRTLSLLPPALAPDTIGRARHFVAWGIELALENLDRLEVRGRDSAGIAIQLTLNPMWSADVVPAPLRTELDRRTADTHADGGSVLIHTLQDGRQVCRFIYKVANLIGKLGDNGNNLRTAIREDALLWEVAKHTQTLGVIAHTRWASNGVINLANCHPVNASLTADEPGQCPLDTHVLGVLNGDVDNYQQLVLSAVESRHQMIPPAILTDAKIIPLLFRLDTAMNEPLDDRVLMLMRRLEGSMAIGLLHPGDPDHLYLAQKGSGQSLFATRANDGWLLASEVYGLAARARHCLPLVQIGQGGIQVTLAGDPESSLRARLIDTGEHIELTAEPIEIFSRDIFRGNYEFYLEKEIHEAPSSVRKTFEGRYLKSGRAVSFAAGEQKDLEPLMRRLSDPALPPVRRIMVTGQGTASVAAMGVAFLIQRVLEGTSIVVDWAKASELSTSFGNRRLADMIVVAISQSGTTTDTNRTVDLARGDGAWVHAIVNRRNSPLVRKSDSRLFTSDGRDVEMAVASTKAFYSQIAAGKLTALCLGQVLDTVDPNQLYDEILALESLPERIQEVLADEAKIAACAAAYAPRHRYWAVVGNGPNKIAAEEIRIKLSELCYRSIPCDFTEDKKHIDLSTEPLTLVIANDLPHLMAQDTAKEVAIFKAHNGKPIVFAALGESCFEPYAEATIYLPSVGAGLDFVVAAVAGHLWGFHAAKAIDRTGIAFRNVAAFMTASLEAPEQVDFIGLQTQIDALLKTIAEGNLEAAIPPRIVAQISQYLVHLTTVETDPAARRAILSDGIALMKTAYDELSRPIDSIRHQAKTVTVGISRPQKDIAPVLRRTLADLSIPEMSLAERDRQLLITLSPVLAGIAGGALYKVMDSSHDWDTEAAPTIQIVQKIGSSAGRASTYEQAQSAAGSKRRALRLGRVILSTGHRGVEKLLLIPVFDAQNWVCERLALLHVNIIPQASLQQKTALLKEMGLYEDAFEAFQEVKPADNFAAFLEATSPQDLIFTPSFRILASNANHRERLS